MVQAKDVKMHFWKPPKDGGPVDITFIPPDEPYKWHTNFGSSPFHYAPPQGFSPWDTSTIDMVQDGTGAWVRKE